MDTMWNKDPTLVELKNDIGGTENEAPLQEENTEICENLEPNEVSLHRLNY